MRRSRALLLTSRWESGPLVLNEALASGCTVIGPADVPSVLDACDGGEFGTAVRRRSAAAFADAIRVELARWEQGKRDPAAIAERWRPRFDPADVCRRLLAYQPAPATA
jgi:glycosyltransferase involved in cell wall biosynthesis